MRLENKQLLTVGWLFCVLLTQGFAGPIRSAAEPDFPPLSIVSSDGKADGFSVELLRAALAGTGEEVAFQTGLWSEIKTDLTEGRLDVLPLIARTPDRKTLFDFSVPYLTLHGALFVRDDETEIKSPEDLQGQRIAVMKGDAAEEYVRSARLSETVILTKTFSEAFQMLSDGRADAVIARQLVGVSLIRNMGLTNIQMTGRPIEKMEQDFCFAVKKGNAKLLAELNEGLSIVIANGTLRRLEHKWIYPVKDAVHDRALVFSDDYAFPPYSFLDKQGRPTGFNVELLRAVAQKTGLTVSFKLAPWDEVRKKMQAGTIDITCMFYPNPEREAWVDFSTPHSVSYRSVFARHNSPPYKTPADLKGRRVAVQKGDALHEYALQLGLEKTLTATKTLEDALTLLKEGQADFALSNLSPGLYWIHKNGWKNLRAVDPRFQKSEYCYVVQKGDTALLDLLNDGLEQIKESGEYRQIYNQWLGVLEPESNWVLIKKITLALSAAGALLTAAAALIIRGLKRQVKKRTLEFEVANQSLKESRQAALNLMEDAVLAKERLELTQFALDQAGDPAFWVNSTGRFVYVNEAACRTLGYNKEELLQLSVPDIDSDVSAELWPSKWQALKGGLLSRFETHHKTKDGRVFPVEIHASYIQYGSREHVCGFAHDITPRKEAEKRLRFEQDLFRSFMDIIPANVYFKDVNSRFVYVNRQQKSIRSKTKGDLLGQTDFDLFPDDQARKKFADEQRVMQIRQPIQIEELSGQTWYQTTKAPRYDENGNIAGTFGISWDITERKRMQEAIEKRIVALTRPLNGSDGITFSDLFELKEIQRVQDEFAAATGVASIITCPDGTPITQPSNFTHLCRDIIRKTEKGCANCFKSDATLGRYHPEGPIVETCLSGGLWDAGVSITVGDRHIANWLIGQVRDETQTEKKMRAYAREIGADEKSFLEAFRKVPAMSREHFEQIARALFTLANQLSASAYQNIQQARFIAEEKKNQTELLRLSTAITHSPEAVMITDPDGIIRYINPAFETITGYSREDALGKTPRFLKSGKYDAAFYSNLWETLAAGKIWEGRFVNKRKNGELYTEEASIAPVLDCSGTITGYVAVKRDITEELIQEEKRRQSQKMEAVGQLAGGIAHDFNNILQAVLGFSEILMKRLTKDSIEHRNAAEIQKAAKRATEMTRQLLAFSRKQPVERVPIDLNATVRDTELLLQLLLGDKTVLTFVLHPALHEIYADHGQITQVIMNLAVNARDAMPDGGRLTISTENITLEPQAVAGIPEAEPGSFVCLSIADTGCGMSCEVKDHLFEPFFTTKDVGQGTGMGLSVVYGIVKQNKGWIHVDSKEGLGTTLKIYLPAGGTPAADNQTDRTHNERILLVEDDEQMRNLVVQTLETAGYKPVAAASAEEALELFKQEKNSIALLFSDILLPGKNGIELADALREEKPGLPVLLYSGYPDQRARWNHFEIKNYHFLQKTSSIDSLLTAVYGALTETNR